MVTLGTSVSIKPLSMEAIRAGTDTSDGDLTLLPKAFGRFSQALSREILSTVSTAPSFSYEGFYRSETRSDREIEENSCLSELLVCAELQQNMRITIDRAVVFGICNVVFGDVGNEPAYNEARPFSKIECAVMQLFFKSAARALPSAFTGLALKEFCVAPRQDPDDENAPPPFKSFVTVKMICNIFGYSGELLVEIPEKLASFFKPVKIEKHVSKPARVSEWGQQISGRVDGMEMELKAVLSEFKMSIEDITGLHAGQMIKLENIISSPVVLCSEGVELFTARLGQTARKFCLSIEASITTPD
jgi:flagellar motor switch protein FliM